MKPGIHPAAVCVCLLLSSCASKPDHFYTLNTLPTGNRVGSATPTVHVVLNASLPPLVDRAEIVLKTSGNGILIAEHERWAGSLSDQVAQTLARDIEMRRNDVFVADRRFDRGSDTAVMVKVDIVRLSAERDGRAGLEAHWHIVDPHSGVDRIGSSAFDTPVSGGGYESVARAYSELLGELADVLVSGMN